MEDRWVWDLNEEGVFCVKDVRNLLDDVFLPKAPIATRWIKYVPIKLNVFAWKVHLNRLPTRVNLQHRGVLISDPSCPICHSEDEDLAHLFFRCSLVTDIVRLVCRWWNIAWASIDSYSNWLHWFNAIRLSPKVKDLLEGVFYITCKAFTRIASKMGDIMAVDEDERRTIYSKKVKRRRYKETEFGVRSRLISPTGFTEVDSSKVMLWRDMPAKKRSQSQIRGVMANGVWIDDPVKVKDEFLMHFRSRDSLHLSGYESREYLPRIHAWNEVVEKVGGVLFSKRFVWTKVIRLYMGVDGELDKVELLRLSAYVGFQSFQEVNGDTKHKE
ncbi:RNA-directed DNA polymerase, eukaryota [Tanacetum coccineum]